MPTKRHNLARRHAVPRVATGGSWPRHANRIVNRPVFRESQVVRGLMVGLPLGTALWMMLALLVWWIA